VKLRGLIFAIIITTIIILVIKNKKEKTCTMLDVAINADRNGEEDAWTYAT